MGLKTCFLAVCALSLTACFSSYKSDAVPAIIERADVSAHTELSALMAKALGQNTVKVSPSMFSDSSILAFEKPDYTGRVLEMPTRFQLLKQGNHCLLALMDSEQKWPLKNVNCRPAP